MVSDMTLLTYTAPPKKTNIKKSRTKKKSEENYQHVVYKKCEHAHTFPFGTESHTACEAKLYCETVS